MHRLSRVLCLAFVAMVSGSASAHEPPTGLLLHLPLDGDIVAKGSLNTQSELISAGGEPSSATPNFVSGRLGQAMTFNGDHAIRLPIDLSYELYPQLTVTAWIMPDGDPTGYVLSTRNSAGPALNVASSWAGLKAPGAQPGESGILRSDRWIFIAGVWDLDSQQVRFHYGRRSETMPITDRLGASAMDTWVGAYDDSLNSAASNLVIDDVRVYGRALTAEEIEGLALGEAAATSEESSSLSMAQTPMQVTSGFEAPDDLEVTGGSAGSLGGETVTGVMDPVDSGIEADSVSTAADEIEEARTAEYERTGPPMYGRIMGTPGIREFPFEVSRGFLNSIGLGVYEMYCGVSLNDEWFWRPLRADRDDKCNDSKTVNLSVELPSANVAAMAACFRQKGSYAPIRGIEIRGDTRRADGSYWNQVDRDVDYGVRCSSNADDEPRFTDLSRCGGGQFATGVVLHVDASDSVVGIQMICREAKNP